jgi:hypothetical protein
VHDNKEVLPSELTLSLDPSFTITNCRTTPVANEFQIRAKLSSRKTEQVERVVPNAFHLFCLRSLHAVSGRGNFEVRILDHPEHIAERIENGRDANSFANILDVCSLSCTKR